MNILFPIAGQGSRFKAEGYQVPKPLVLVNGTTLLEHSIKTLGLDGHYIFVTLRYPNARFNNAIREIVDRCCPSYSIVELEAPTQGAAQTCLAASHLIDNTTPLVVTNCDQYLKWDPNQLLREIQLRDPDACVSLYDHEDVEVDKPSKYAFVELDDKGYAFRFCEKYAISTNALNGIHYWKSGELFVSYIELMITKDIKVNGEYYISPSLNLLINAGGRITTFKMECGQYYSLGSPQEVSNNKQHIN